MNETVACAMYSPQCAGRLEWHHVIRQQRIKRAFPYGASAAHSFIDRPSLGRWKAANRHNPIRRAGEGRLALADILGDPRNRVWLCSHHHELVTNGRIDVALPDSVWEFAREFGLDAQLENDLARRAA